MSHTSRRWRQDVRGTEAATNSAVQDASRGQPLRDRGMRRQPRGRSGYRIAHGCGPGPSLSTRRGGTDDRTLAHRRHRQSRKCAPEGDLRPRSFRGSRCHPTSRDGSTGCRAPRAGRDARQEFKGMHRVSSHNLPLLRGQGPGFSKMESGIPISRYRAGALPAEMMRRSSGHSWRALGAG